MLRRKSLQCQQVVELLSDYLEHALPRRLVRLIDAHLALCPNCTAYLEQLRTTTDLASALRGEDVPDEVVDALSEAFDTFHRESGTRGD